MHFAEIRRKSGHVFPTGRKTLTSTGFATQEEAQDWAWAFDDCELVRLRKYFNGRWCCDTYLQRSED